jgi:hypothetical protein
MFVAPVNAEWAFASRGCGNGPMFEHFILSWTNATGQWCGISADTVPFAGAAENRSDTTWDMRMQFPVHQSGIKLKPGHRLESLMPQAVQLDNSNIHKRAKRNNEDLS